MSTEPQFEPAAGPAPFPSEAVKETVENLARDANSALNGVADAIGLTERVEKAPYAMVAAALGIGYVIGGGLFTATTMRLLRLGVKLASVPLVRERILDFAEGAVDQVLHNAGKNE